MKPLTAQLEFDGGSVKFYRLNRKITKGKTPLFGNNVDVIQEMAFWKEKSKWKDAFSDDGCDLIAVSDAHTHDERIVFTAIQNPTTGEYSRTRVEIGGKMTMKIHGGDKSTMKPIEVYLRRLQMINQ